MAKVVSHPAPGIQVRLDPDHHPPPAPFPLCFTPEALAQLLGTVGSTPPEAGAKGFGPKDRIGFDVIEFDEHGSARARVGVFSPDAEWGEARQQYWLDQPNDDLRLWTGDIHSHPGRMGFPSARTGMGLGDLGYVEEVFRLNEWMQYFCMPIITRAGTGAYVDLHPWVIGRKDPSEPTWAEVRVCSVNEFPSRVFSPEWELRVAQAEPVSLDVARLADLLGSPADCRPMPDGGLLVQIQYAGICIRLQLPRGFPYTTPTVNLVRDRGEAVQFPIRWAGSDSTVESERRLAELCRGITAWLGHSY